MELLQLKDLEEVSSRTQLDELIEEATQKKFKEIISDRIENKESPDSDIDSLIDNIAELVDASFEAEDQGGEEQLATIEDTINKLREIMQEEQSESIQGNKIDKENQKLYEEYKTTYSSLYLEAKRDTYTQYSQVQKNKRAQAVKLSIPEIAESFGPLEPLIQRLDR